MFQLYPGLIAAGVRPFKEGVPLYLQRRTDLSDVLTTTYFTVPVLLVHCPSFRV
jgi:hypothetical protein